MTKKIISALLGLTVLFMTGCSGDSVDDTSKTENSLATDTTTTVVTESNKDWTPDLIASAPADTSKKEEKNTTKTEDKNSKGDNQTDATTTTAKAQADTTTKQAAATIKSTVKATTKTTTKAQATNYIGKCHACGSGVTSSNCVKLGDGTFYCNACKNAHKCYNCGKVCSSSNGIEAWTPWGTIYQCYSCRPDLKPEPLPKDIKGTDAEARTEAQIVVDLTNKLRASYGFGSLKTDSRLTAAAMARAKELATLYSHTRPNGNSGGTISLEYNRNACPNGENIQMQCSTGYEEGKDIYQAWENSPGHKATMLDKSSTYIGVGIYYVYKNGSKYTYSVQLFLNGI
ncbi:CAP domain-containing protein [Ruminococcus sp. FC2018]|uniref:CAP domain-containing protein n=1 Tax=Ruminococcus sp. FC2018 TaxID=1410617 RepID=UPI000688C9E1|nr:CAP domain-containing protein [Ruminococcus sp. FC2018]